MRCAWQEYIKLLPIWLRKEVDDRCREDLQELRLRSGQPPTLVTRSRKILLDRAAGADDINYVINAASQYSPWAVSTISKGYITASGGHRIGICGETVVQNGVVTGIRTVTSICVRVARDFPEIAGDASRYSGSVLIIGPPCSGKTTLLRDLIRQRSNRGNGSIAVMDERAEIFPIVNGCPCYPTGENTDILTGCSKQQGIDMLLRTMGPSCIAVDEITEEADCRSLINAGWSGVTLLATAHAATKSDLYSRPIYRPLISNQLFDTLLVMQRDKSWKAERI